MSQYHSKPIQVAVIGAGFISDIHMRVLSILKEVQVCAVCDLDINKAKALQKKWSVPHVFHSIDKMLKEIKLDVVHVIVPPPFHAEVTEQFLAAGISVFLEKPMATSTEECQKLISFSNNKKVKIGVNHNFSYNPVYQKILKYINSNRIGKIQHIIVVSNMPLRQLATRDFSHWMFQDPKNIIFEQGPHPFSLIYNLLGHINKMQTVTSGKHILYADKVFYDTWQISMECKKGSAQLYYAVGKELTENWIHIIGQDGSIKADLLNNTYSIYTKSKSEYFSSLINAFQNIFLLAMQSTTNTINYLFSILKLKEPNDPFYQGMKCSIREFYRSYRQGKNPSTSGEDGMAVIEYCEKATAHISSNTLNQEKINISMTNKEERADVLIIGATGFIGGHLIKALLKTNKSIRIMVRRPEYLPLFLINPRIQVVKGDITNEASVCEAIKGVSVVYHLATGSGDTWDEIKKSMVGGLRNVANICLKENVNQLIFTSTTAVYTFDGNKAITEESPLDQYPEKRSLYCRAKILCENMLWEMHNSSGLPITIFRPAVVVGKGGIPEHSAIGFWVNDLHCIGWSSGKISLPFVLVEDVASGLVNGLKSEKAIGHSFNLAGDVYFNAQEYIKYLSKAQKRKICFHPRSTIVWFSHEIAIWAIKKLIGRSDAQLTTYRDLKARALRTPIDCTKAKNLLGWEPNKNVDTFIKTGIESYSCSD